MSRMRIGAAFLSLIFLIACTSTPEQGPATPTTIHELWAAKDTLLGTEILVIGTVERIETRCTGQACTDTNPCCSGCYANVGFILPGGEQIKIVGTYEGREIGCWGDNCAMECAPLQPGEEYVVRGTLERTLHQYKISLLEIAEG